MPTSGLPRYLLLQLPDFQQVDAKRSCLQRSRLLLSITPSIFGTLHADDTISRAVNVVRGRHALQWSKNTISRTHFATDTVNLSDCLELSNGLLKLASCLLRTTKQTAFTLL